MIIMIIIIITVHVIIKLIMVLKGNKNDSNMIILLVSKRKVSLMYFLYTTFVSYVISLFIGRVELWMPLPLSLTMDLD